jgi:hypothetical protein
MFLIKEVLVGLMIRANAHFFFQLPLKMIFIIFSYIFLIKMDDILIDINKE